MDDPGSLLLRNYNKDKDLGMGGDSGYSDYLEIYANIPTILTVQQASSCTRIVHTRLTV